MDIGGQPAVFDTVGIVINLFNNVKCLRGIRPALWL